MTPQELKNSILLLAVQGKITERHPEDGDTRDLLPKLCIDNSLPRVEEPFDIPENWLWLPIGSLGESTDTDSFCDGPFGSNLKTVHYIYSPEVRIIQLSNIGENGWKDANVKYTSFRHLEEVIPRCEVHPGDLVIAKMMPAGRTIEVPELGTRITLGSDAMKFVPNRILNKQYLLYAMASQAFLGQVYAEAHGITRVRTTLKGVKSYVLPIPPLAEQERIVAKIEELLPLIDRYEKAWTKLEDFNKRFPGDMQNSILQMAIQGKLVEQRPEEGTAEELYQQIQAEKQALIKAGKIKKDRRTEALAFPQEDEIPFDIPETWKWTYLGSILNKLTDGTHKTPKYSTSGIKFVSVKDMSSGVLYLDNTKYITESEHEELYARCDPVKGDMLLSKVGTTGVPAIVDTDEPFSLFVSVALLKFSHDCLEPHFLYYLLKSPLVQLQAAENTRGVGNKNWVLDAIAKTVVPLPPLAEQKRIVAKLEELLPLCEKLK